MTHHAPLGEYDGPARVLAGETEVSVDVRLRGHFEPIDGRFHWFGRIARADALDAAVTPGTTVRLTTGHGSAVGRLSDIDPWGRYRVTGLGRPPF